MQAKKAATKKKASVKKETIDHFQVVAIGASAGGLEAITVLLKELESDTGMAFIYVQHLSPEHKSMLTSILAKTTSIKVQEIKNKVLIEPNHFYVIPPDKEMNVKNGHIILSPRPKSPVSNLPIDILFSSLAESHKENVIGIILSGSAHDGTEGMKKIKLNGGLTYAQDESAKFNSMPKSAIAAGVVDFILSPKEIAHELNRLSKHPNVETSGLKTGQEELINNNDPDLKNILILLHKATNVDFSAYKTQTIKRRVLRRMLLYKINTLKEYADLIAGKREELDILYQDLLINVTSFFRDSESHKYLKTTLIPRLLKNKKKGDNIRIWVPACSTGEEAFSVAMILSEILNNKISDFKIQIFATDISAKAIRKARAGIYSKSELEKVSPMRIQKFFTKSTDKFQIIKSIRDMCVFAQHNILLDPPFSRLDFISCRNLFIYLNLHAQKRALACFQFALIEGGLLMLGKSEAISNSKHLFTELNKHFKVYIRKNSNMPNLPVFPPRFNKTKTQIELSEDVETTPKKYSKTKILTDNQILDNAIDSVLVSDYMPPSVVINHQLEILQFRGATDLYFSHSAGKASLNILKMARAEIVFSLRNAISKAISSNKIISKKNIEIIASSVVHTIGFEVVPLKIEWDEPLILIVFSENKEKTKVDRRKKIINQITSEKDNKIKRLEEEIIMAHTDSLIYSKEQEAFIEELQSAHEEVVSSNEELQTMNEELETSKEEIEATNEELTTANQELQTSNDLLNESYDYSSALISTLHEPLIVLDKEFRVKTASKSFYKKFGVKVDDTEGNLLFNLGNKQWNIPSLRKLLEDILPQNTNIHNFEVRHTFPGIGSKILLLNAGQIEQKSQDEKLILISINDITERIQLEEKEKKLLNKAIKESEFLNEKLELEVKKRTKELLQSNITLKKSNLELDKINKELEAFTYISSHDLQEPLRKIQIFIDLILNKENKNISETGVKYFKFIQNSAGRMQLLINDLLEFSLLSTSERKFEKVIMNDLIEEVISDFTELIKQKKAKIVVSKSNCEVPIVPFQFRQLFHNLINNSLKFSKTNVPPRITISTQIMEPDKSNKNKLLQKKSYCHICITDNGIGIDKTVIENIFQVFRKLHKQDQYPGTGIGLSIVKKVVENHNGIITVNSELNKGTKFDIYIPKL